MKSMHSAGTINNGDLSFRGHSRRRPDKIRVAIDAMGAKHSGAATVLLSVIDSALSTDWVEKLIVFCSPREARDFDLGNDPRLVEVGIASASGGGLGRAAWHRYGLPTAVRKHGGMSLLCLSGGGEAPFGIPSTTLIQQSIPFAPEVMVTLPLSTRIRMRAIKMMMRRSCGRAVKVVVQTPTMKRWLIRDFGLSAQKVHVIELGPTMLEGEGRERRTPVEMSGVPADRRILYVGNASPYKNLSLLGPAMMALRKDIPEATLFVTLPRGHEITNYPGIVALGRILPERLPDYYRAATVLLMPSLVETVGLPMLEAASFGTMVVAADRSYAHDVCGPAAIFFDPLQAGSLAAALGKAFRDPELRMKIGGLGQELAREKAIHKPYNELMELLHDEVIETHVAGNAEKVRA